MTHRSVRRAFGDVRPTAQWGNRKGFEVNRNDEYDAGGVAVRDGERLEPSQGVTRHDG